MERSSSLVVGRLTGFILCACMLAAQPTGAQQLPGNRYPPQMDGAKVEVYKTVGDVKLNLLRL